MIILGFHPGYHDGAAAVYDEYRLVAAVALERLTRRKGDGGGVPQACIDEVLDIAGVARGDVGAVVVTRTALPWRYYTHFRGGRYAEGKVRQWLGKEKLKDMTLELRRAGTSAAGDIFDAPKFLTDHGFRADAALRFCNHHFAHALPAIFFTDWDDALIYTADGGGDHVQYSQHVLRDGTLSTLYGDDSTFLDEKRIDSLGLAYGYATQALGYRINRHEGKLTGLAGYGTPSLYDEFAAHFNLDDDGQIHSDFASFPDMKRFIFELAEDREPADVAASVQQLLEDMVLASVRRLLERHPVRHLGLSGGVFANVRLNRLLAESTDVDEVFVVPPMGDDGLSIGGPLDFLLSRDGLKEWLARRYRLTDVYLGRDYGARVDDALGGAPGIAFSEGNPAEEAARRLTGGEAGAIYAGRMEFGPRALGARSILASPADPRINDVLNRRLQRTEFMPFAPVVTEADAAEVFEIGRLNRYAGRFMTITCAVKDAWRERIPAVVHVDGTARPQLIERERNPLYFDILAAFKAATGLPVLINTSFNVHEEPIVNRPEECLRALTDGRIDFCVTDRGIYAPA